MNRYRLTIALLVLATVTFGQVVERHQNETAEQFASRLKPDSSEIVHKVLETKWNDRPLVIAFYGGTYTLANEAPDQQIYTNIVATLYLQIDSSHFRKYVIDTIGSDGGDPEIQSVFFVNADTDPKKELALLITWHQIHYDYGGDWYGTFLYKMPDSKPGTVQLEFLDSLSSDFYGCECDFRDGTSKKAKFKTVADVKAELKRLGFK